LGVVLGMVHQAQAQNTTASAPTVTGTHHPPPHGGSSKIIGMPSWLFWFLLILLICFILGCIVAFVVTKIQDKNNNSNQSRSRTMRDIE